MKTLALLAASLFIGTLSFGQISVGSGGPGGGGGCQELCPGGEQPGPGIRPNRRPHDHLGLQLTSGQSAQISVLLEDLYLGISILFTGIGVHNRSNISIDLPLGILMDGLGTILTEDQMSMLENNPVMASGNSRAIIVILGFSDFTRVDV